MTDNNPGNTHLTAQVIAKALLVCVKNEMVMGNPSIVNHAYQEEFHKKVNGYESGDTIDVERPSLFYAQDGRINSNVQALKPGKTQIKVNKQKSVRWGFNSAEMTMSVQGYADKHLKSAGAALAQTLDRDLMSMVDDLYHVVGTPGTVPTTFSDISPFAERMDDMAVSPRDRSLILSPNSLYSVANDQSKLFNSGMNQTAYRKAQIGEIANLATFKTQNTQLHYTGDWTGTPKIDAANQHKTWEELKDKEHQELGLKGLTATKWLKRGDVFTIAGVYALNPVPGELKGGVVDKKQMPYLQQFVVKEDVQVDGAGKAVVKTKPFIITVGAHRTVSASPAADAVVAFLGEKDSAYDQNFAVHKSAFSVAIVPLVLPHGAAWKARATHEGVSVRVTKEYDQEHDVETIRADMLYGFRSMRDEFGVRQWSKKVA